MRKIYTLVETDGYEDYATFFFNSKEDAALAQELLEQNNEGTTYYVILAESLYDSIDDFKERY